MQIIDGPPPFDLDAWKGWLAELRDQAVAGLDVADEIEVAEKHISVLEAPPKGTFEDAIDVARQAADKLT